MSYQTRAAQKLHELYYRYKDQAGGMVGMILSGMGPAIPSVLRNIDENPELRQQVAEIVRELAEAFEEDTQEQIGGPEPIDLECSEKLGFKEDSHGQYEQA